MALTALMAWVRPAPAADGSDARVALRSKSDFRIAVDPVGVDLNLDGTLEIVIVHESNHVTALVPDTLKPLWHVELDITGQLNDGPIWGHFLGDGTIDIILIDSSGRLIVLDGLTGTPLSGFTLPDSPATDATVIPVVSDELGLIEYRDGVVVMMPSGQLISFVINSHASPSTFFNFQLQGTYSQPAATGLTGYSAPGPHLVTVSNQGRITVMSAVEGSRMSISYDLKARRVNHAWFALGDITGDGLDDIVVADDSGYLTALRVEGERFVEVWPAEVSIFTKPTYPPLIADINGDDRADILITKVNKFVLVNGATGLTGDIWEVAQFNHSGDITSPPSLHRGADGKVYAAYSDNGGVFSLFDVRARGVRVGSDGTRLELKPGGSARVSPIVGDIRGEGGTEVFLLNSPTGSGTLLELDLPWAEDSLPWFGLLGGPRRLSAVSGTYRAYLTDQNASMAGKVEKNISSAQEYYEQGDWTKAREFALEALAANPFSAEASSIKRWATIRENLLLIVMGFILSMAALGGLGYLTTRVTLRTFRLTMAKRALTAGDRERAASFLLAVHKAWPNRDDYLGQLADLYIESRVLTTETAPVFMKAREAFPKDETYIKALATCFSSERRRDERAAVAYADMVRISTHPGPWAFILGQAYVEIGQDRAALDAFHKSVRHGFDDPVMPNYLADLYIKLAITAPEIVPTMKRVLGEREVHEPFLRTFCEACRESRLFDDDAEKAAVWLLRLEPKSIVGHTILATRLLQASKIKDSLRHAEAILEAEPNDPTGLRLLGACYAAEKRLDSTAMQIFSRALESNPHANDILVAVSHSYIQDERKDAEARDIYMRAIEGSPGDETILEQLARIASDGADDDLTIRVVGTLADLGRTSRELAMQLAEAYCRKGALDSKAKRAYIEALSHQPDHISVAAQLAKIYIAEERTDPDAAEIYERVFEAHPELTDVGKQLARSYNKAELAEQTLELARKLLVSDPEDHEMEKLVANASALLDNMDSAIASYEQIIERNPDDAESICRLSHLYGKKRLSNPKVMKIYQRAIKIQPDDLESHMALARACAETLNWDQCVMTIKHLLTQAPNKINIVIATMEELVGTGRDSMALRWFLADTLIYNGRLRDADNQLIDILRLDGSQAKRALSAYERILDKSPKESRAHHHRGRLLMGLGREAEARHSLEQAKRFSPSDEGIIRDLMGLYQKILEKRDSSDVRFALGKLAMQALKWDIAISCFQQTDKDYRWESESVQNLSRCFMAKGMLDLALQELRRLPVADETKNILYELGQRYEAVNDLNGAREVYKSIFAVDISYKDVQGKLEAFAGAQADPMAAERTAIIQTLSEEAAARYELIKEIGRGAMGIVYKARDNELDEIVALKILPDTLGNNPEALRRFKQEARNARRLSHPNIVRIHDIGEQQGRKYISMEYVDGSDLKERIRVCKRKVPLAEVLPYAIQIAEALGAAADANIVHRDIKPANIMITKRGKVKITDFGIAKMIQDDTGTDAAPAQDATRAGAIIGTPLYMSPEQVQGNAIDARTDIYAYGIVMYELAEGKPPFTEGDLAYHHLFTEPPPIQRAGVPDKFKQIIMKCIQKKPEDRWQSAREIIDELRKIELPDAELEAG